MLVAFIDALIGTGCIFVDAAHERDRLGFHRVIQAKVRAEIDGFRESEIPGTIEARAVSITTQVAVEADQKAVGQATVIPMMDM